MTTAGTFNRTAIMTHAWDIVRRANVALYGLRTILRRALRAAWSEAKHKLAIAQVEQKTKTQSPEVARTREAIAALEGKDRWTQADYARIGVLRAALRATEDHEAAAPDYVEKRGLIASAGGRFCAVTFTKADGTKRTLQVQPATLQHHIKGDDATDAGKRVTQTRKARHLHLARLGCKGPCAPLRKSGDHLADRR